MTAPNPLEPLRRGSGVLMFSPGERNPEEYWLSEGTIKWQHGRHLAFIQARDFAASLSIISALNLALEADAKLAAQAEQIEKLKARLRALVEAARPFKVIADRMRETLPDDLPYGMDYPTAGAYRALAKAVEEAQEATDGQA